MRSESTSGAELDKAWRGPRWWQRVHGTDPQHPQAILAIFGGTITTGLGIALLIADKVVAEGAVLTIIGIATLLVGIWGIRRRK